MANSSPDSADNIVTQLQDNKQVTKVPYNDTVLNNAESVRNLEDEKRKLHEDKPWLFKPGNRANPGGRPRTDLAAIIADEVFKHNPEGLKKSLYKHIIRKGDAQLVKVLSDRAYGKLTDRVELTGSMDLAIHLQQSRTKLELPEAHLDDEIVEGEIVEADSGLADLPE